MYCNLFKNFVEKYKVCGREIYKKRYIKNPGTKKYLKKHGSENFGDKNFVIKLRNKIQEALKLGGGGNFTNKKVKENC